MLDFLIIIQSRLYSTRLPGKAMMMVGGIPMVKRVWLAAKQCMTGRRAKVIVAWPERYPDLDENNVLERFRRIANEFPSKCIIRLTSDCPLLEAKDIEKAVYIFNKLGSAYHNNHLDGKDVQIFRPWVLGDSGITDWQHVIADFRTKKGRSDIRSVDTEEDLRRVRNLCKTK